MNKQREALQVALDTLRGWIGIDEWIWPITAKETCKKNSLEAIAAIREALAEQEPWTPDDMAYRPGGLPMDAQQEPVAWMCADESLAHNGYSRFSRTCAGDWNIPVYTAPPARKPLTDEEIQEMRYSLDFPCNKHPFINIVKAVERAHGIGGGE